LDVDFASGLKWGGKGGRFEVHRDETENAWYASVPVEVGADTARKENKSKYILHGDQSKSSPPKGDEVASVDLGIK